LRYNFEWDNRKAKQNIHKSWNWYIILRYSHHLCT